MVYTGIDASAEMKSMAGSMFGEVFAGSVNCRMLGAFAQLDASFWEGCSELPSLVVFSMSYFFSRVSAQYSEHLALQISEIMRQHPLNRYLFVIQQSECDAQLNSFTVFKRILTPLVSVFSSGVASLPYVFDSKERMLPFGYEIYCSR